MEGEDIAVGPGGSNGGAKRGRRKKKEGVQYDQGLVKGSEEWSRLKKDNHKEVERRRRETINDGINELKKIVPGCDKNKGSILQRAVQYLLQLKENEAQNIEKWTLEKMLNEQSVKDLNGEIERLNKTLEEREGQLRGLRERLKEREEELGRLKGIGAKRLREDEGVEGDEAAKRARV
ncbi:hypothetical protein BT69DRAFT_1214945 [Atractiella rhizophila]|nr:hypothetical protein BT69DRAFT_1214945 [Atractiella rhizophila]